MTASNTTRTSIEPAEALEKDADKIAADFENRAKLNNPTQPPILWDDPRETRNPQNWSSPSKLFHTLIPCLLAFEITFSTSVTVPATSLIAAEFNVSRTQSLLPLTLYTLGLAFGPIFIAPLSEVFGRKWVYVITTSLLLVFIGGSARAHNFTTLLILRLLAGFFGSAGIAIGAGSIADIWALEKTGAQVSLLFILGPFLGPTLGPLAGAYILKNENNDWRWTQYLLLMVGAPIWVGTVIMKETSRKWITRRENGSQSKITGTRLKKLIQAALVRPTKMLFTEIIVFSLAIYTAFAYAVVFSYFTSGSYVLQLWYGFNLRQVGLSFISVIIGYILATIMFGVFDKTLYARARSVAPDGIPGPEHRLYSAFAGSIFLPIGLFWYAWAAHKGDHWAAVVAAGIPFGFGAFSLFLSTITYMVDFFRAEAAASALAANGFLRYTLGATFPLFTLQMYERLGVHWAGSVFAFLSLLLIPIPWLLFKFSDYLKQHTNFVVKNDSEALEGQDLEA